MCFYQFSWIDLNTLFPEMECVVVFEASKKLFFKFKQDCYMSHTISAVFISGFEQVFAYKEISYVIKLVIFTTFH